MPIIVTITTEDMNRSRCAVRKEIAGWLWGARLLRRYGLLREAAFIERHAADYKAWAGARSIPITGIQRHQQAKSQSPSRSP